MVGGREGMVGGREGMVGGREGRVGGREGMVGGREGMVGGREGMVGGREGMVGGREGATEKTLRLIMSLSFRNSFSVMRFQSGPAATRAGHSDLRPTPIQAPHQNNRQHPNFI